MQALDQLVYPAWLVPRSPNPVRSLELYGMSKRLGETVSDAIAALPKAEVSPRPHVSKAQYAAHKRTDKQIAKPWMKKR